VNCHEGNRDSVFENIPLAYAKHRIRYNGSHEPEDLEFVSINRSYEKLLGMDRHVLTGRGLVEVFPEIAAESFKWFDLGVRVALGGGPVSFLEPFLSLGGWVSGQMYSNEKDCLEVIFNQVDPRAVLGFEAKAKSLEKNPLAGSGVTSGGTLEGLAGDFISAGEIDLLISHMRDGIMITDRRGRILLCNPAALTMTGWEKGRAMGGDIREIFKIIHPKTRDNLTGDLFDILARQNRFEMRGLDLCRHDSGEALPIEGTLTRFQRPGTGEFSVLVTFRDDSAHRQRYRRFEEFSYRDPLTGIHNRRYLEEGLRRLDVKRNLPLAVMMIDINGLKSANDRYGHQVGDQIIQLVGSILKSVCREEDIVARVGGDEFEILLPRTPRTQASKIKKRILKAAMTSPGPYGPVEVAVGYGVKTAVDECIGVTRARADRDMYRDKHRRKGSSHPGDRHD
jgi:diguanylate cyclase (GGDEF)-like protein/PAS domain S-box-containing protein